MKFSDVVKTYRALDEMANQKLPVKTSYFVTMNLRRLEPEMKFFEQERLKIVSSDCKIIDGLLVPNEGMQEKTQADFNNLLNLESGFQPYMIRLMDFEAQLTPIQMNILLTSKLLIEE